MKKLTVSLLMVLLSVLVATSAIQAQKKNTQKVNFSTETKKVTKPSSTTSNAPPHILVGDWLNSLGSTLTITSVNAVTGKITGTYVSPSGRFPLIGWINSLPRQQGKNNVLVVSFSVRWKNRAANFGSVTAWNGYYTIKKGKHTIVGQWLLSRAVSSFQWDHILTGQDVFSKIISKAKSAK